VPANGGIEAVAVLAGGAFLVVTEDAKLGAARVRGWLVDGDRAMALSYVQSGRFKPTDFAVLPSGDVIALECRSIPPLSIAARLRIFPARAIGPGATLDGRALIYLVSDDNFNPPQNTILLMFHLAP